MRAAVLNTIPGQLEIEDISIDKPAPNEVLIRVAASGLCHTDLHFMDGHLKTELPVVLGHETSGVVEQVGADVNYVQPGDHVVACLSIYCGNCAQCLSGHPSICENPDASERADTSPPRLHRSGQRVGQFMRLGGFAEQMLVHQNAIAKISPDMPLDRAALLGCGVTTGLGAAFNTATVSPGATVAVFGCGAIGLNVVQGARISGAEQIICVDNNRSKLDTALRFGATDLVDASTTDPVETIMELTGGRGVTHSFEAVGSSQTARQAFMCLAKGGTATVIGLMGADEQVELPGLHFLAERKIQGCDMGSNRFRIDMPRYAKMYLDGRLNLDDMMSETIGLEDVNKGFDAMRTGKTIRSIITFE